MNEDMVRVDQRHLRTSRHPPQSQSLRGYSVERYLVQTVYFWGVVWVGVLVTSVRDSWLWWRTRRATQHRLPQAQLRFKQHAISGTSPYARYFRLQCRRGVCGLMLNVLQPLRFWPFLAFFSVERMGILVIIKFQSHFFHALNPQIWLSLAGMV